MTRPTTDPTVSPAPTFQSPTATPAAPAPTPAADAPTRTKLTGPRIAGAGRSILSRTTAPAAGPSDVPEVPSPAAGPADPIREDVTPSGSPSGRREGARAARVDKTQLRKVARGLVAQTGLALHRYATTTQEQRDAGVWLADAADQSGIGDPLADIAARRLGPEFSPDVASLIEAGANLLGYVLANAGKIVELARARRGAGTPDLTEQGSGLVDAQTGAKVS